MIKQTLERLRALELERQGLETRKRMLEKEQTELLELVLERSLAGDDQVPNEPLLYQYSAVLDGVVAVVSIAEEYWDLPRGHSDRVSVEFIPTMDGMGVLS